MIGSIGELTIGELPSRFDNSEPSLFGELLKDSEAEVAYLIELSPYDATTQNFVNGVSPVGVNPLGSIGFTYTGGIKKQYISDKGYMTEPNENPANRSYLPLTTNPFQLDVSILNGEIFGGGVPSFGAIRLLNGDGELEELMDYYWSGRDVSVFVGGVDFERSQFEALFQGYCTQPEFTEDEIIINISDKTLILETEFTQSIYEGTGDLEGGDDIEGVVKPILYGECKNVAPVLIDAANLIYQLHDGSMEGVTAVYDRGVEITAEGDVADITAASVSAGHYKTQLSGGYIKLGSSPDGLITCDAKGDNAGGYVDNAGAIISRIVKTKLGVRNFSSNDIDQGAFNNLDAIITGSIGYNINSITNAKRIIDDILTGLQCYWTFTRQGVLTAGVIDEPSIATTTITEEDIVDNSIEVTKVIPPSWRISMGYGFSWITQTADDLASATTTAHQTFVSESYRSIVSETRNVRTLSPLSSERLFISFLVNQSDALNEVERLGRIYKTQRKIYKVVVLGVLFRTFIGSVIELKINRFGLSEGKNFIITAMSEDAESGQTTLELWG